MSICEDKTSYNSDNNSEPNFSNLTINEIKCLTQKWHLDFYQWKILEKDRRSGVRKLAEQAFQRRERSKREKERQEKCLIFEQQLWNSGLSNVAGVDEVGRGCLAGPVVAAAVILPVDFDLPGLNDSKKLSKVKRKELDKDIRDQAVAFSYSEIDAGKIDSVNILQASLEAMRNTLLALKVSPDKVLVDGHIRPHSPFPEMPIVDGDSRSLSIAAASVIAKVYRDQRMCEIDIRFPGYGFAENKGYGSPFHLNALKTKGITPEHRKTFAPVRSLVEVPSNLFEILSIKINSCRHLGHLEKIGQEINLSKSSLESMRIQDLRILYRNRKQWILNKKSPS